jgi:hypothetical protein
MARLLNEQNRNISTIIYVVDSAEEIKIGLGKEFEAQNVILGPREAILGVD